MSRVHPVLLAALAALALGAAPARAAFFPSESIDGPSPDILRIADIDTAQDGGSAVVYLKRDSGVPHVFVSRMTDGIWGPPLRLDAGQLNESSDPHVGVSDDGKAVVTWINQGRLFSSVLEPGAPTWAGPTEVHPGPVQRNSLGVSVHGAGYVAFSVGGASRDVRVARLAGTGWNVFEEPLDLGTARDAGGGRGPRVAAAADGTATVVWQEIADGVSRVFVRRALRDRLSRFAAEASVSSIEGHPGGTARNPEVGMDWDSSFGWVVLEQDFADNGLNRSRVFGRRIVGVGLDEEPVLLDSLAWGGTDSATDPDIDVTGRLRALTATTLLPYAGVGAAVLQIEVFGPIGRIDSNAGTTDPDPTAAHASNGEGAFMWHEDSQVIGKYWNRDNVLEGDVPIAFPAFGDAQPTLGIDSSANRLGEVAVAFIQGPPLERRLVVAHWDRPLRAITPASATQAWQSNRRPQLRWGRVTELWGSPQYRVEIDGQPVATQPGTVLDLPFDLADGTHPWRIVTIDRRGQETPGSSRNLNIDTTKPVAVLATTGTLRAGQSIKFVARDDPPPQPPLDPGAPAPPAIRTSGLQRMTASFGDRTRATGTREVRHVYRKKGNYRVRIVVRDRAGNQSIVKLRIRVANPRKMKKR